MSEWGGRTAAALRDWLGVNRFLVVFAVLASIMGVCVGIAKITTALYAVELGATPEQLGLIIAGQFAGTVLMSIPVGHMVGHYGPQRLFLLGSGLAGLTYALIPLWQTTEFLLGCTLAISFFMPMRFVSLNVVFFEQIRLLGESKAGWYRGTHMSGQYLIGPGAAVALIAAWGYAGTWWVLALSFAFTIAVSPVVFRRYGRRGEADSRMGGRAMLAGMLELLRDRHFRRLCLVDISGTAVMIFQATFIVVIVLRVFFLGEAEASAYVTGGGLAFIVALFFGGAALTTRGASTTLRAGSVLVVLGLACLGLASQPWWFWPGVLLLGAGLGLIQTVTLAALARAGHRFGQGRVSGMVSLIQPLGALLGGLCGGWVGQRLGLQAVFLFFIPGYLLLCLMPWQES